MGAQASERRTRNIRRVDITEGGIRRGGFERGTRAMVATLLIVTVKIFESKILINFDIFEVPESE